MSPLKQARLEEAIAQIRHYGRANARCVAFEMGLSENVARDLLMTGRAAGRLARCPGAPGYYMVRNTHLDNTPQG